MEKHIAFRIAIDKKRKKEVVFEVEFFWIKLFFVFVE